MTYLEYLRKQKLKVTQKEFAKLAKMSHSDVNKIERGRLNPYPDQLERLADVLKFPKEDLLREVVISLPSNPEVKEVQ